VRFNWITTFAAPTLAVLALTGAFYRGDRLSIDFPEGWTVTGPDKDELVTATEPGDSVNCNVQTRDLAALGNATLADINADYGHVFTVAEWADLLGQKSEDITLEVTNMSPFADAFYHTATFRMKVDATKEVSVRYGFYVLPGRISMAGCYVLTADYPGYKARFEKVVDSFRPW
jgi:hypothetical protein